MKLALAIVVCISLYLRAVSGMRPEKIFSALFSDDLKFQRILAFVKDDPKYQYFPQTVNGHPIYQNFLTDNKGYPEFVRYLPRNKNNDKNEESYQLLKNDKKRYKEMRKNWEICESYHREEDFKIYNTFIGDVIDQYTEIVQSSGRHMRNKNNWLKQHFDEELMKADLDFKLKCILAFRAKSSSSSSSSCSGVSNNAYAVLEEQLEIFIDDLMDCVWYDSAKDDLKEISEKEDFLRFFGLWFATDWEKDDMNTELNNMKRGRYWGSDNDKAAKLMVLMKMFREGKN